MDGVGMGSQAVPHAGPVDHRPSVLPFAGSLASRAEHAFLSLRHHVRAPGLVPRAVAPGSSQPRPASRTHLTARGSTPFSSSCSGVSSIWVLVCALTSCDRRVVFGDPAGARGTVS